MHDATGNVSRDDIMRAADVACFMAKEKGRNRVHIHREQDLDLSNRVREMNWVQRIQHALDEDRFSLRAGDRRAEGARRVGPPCRDPAAPARRVRPDRAADELPARGRAFRADQADRPLGRPQYLPLPEGARGDAPRRADRLLRDQPVRPDGRRRGLPELPGSGVRRVPHSAGEHLLRGDGDERDPGSQRRAPLRAGTAGVRLHFALDDSDPGCRPSTT